MFRHMPRHPSHKNAGPHIKFGDQVRAARLARSLSQEKLAERVGIGRRHLIKIENGEHLPRPELADRISNATGTRLELPEDDEESSVVRLTATDLAAAIVLAIKQMPGVEVAA